MYLQQIDRKLAPHPVFAKMQKFQLYWQLVLIRNTKTITCYDPTVLSVTMRDLKNLFSTDKHPLKCPGR